ncbi:lantibiotic dehydratase [Streptomyces sparsogenes]|uniref:lantibiotic dehydratase n=1 Tax=Streptomyces sparsogenes TaxID=67365 RepID=UPI0033DCA532
MTAEFAMARLATLPVHHPMPVGPDDPGGEQDSTLAFLRAVAADPVLAEVIAVSSPSLARTLRDVTESRHVKPAKLRRVCFATMRYLSRATHRATPFGLLAGVAPATLGDAPEVRVGDQHIKFVYADYGWLAGMARSLRTDPVVLPNLTLVTNEFGEVRDGRFVLAHLPVDDTHVAPHDVERTIRRTTATALVLETARTPIRHPDLVAVLRSKFPEVEAAVIHRMIAQLVDSEFLLTDLLPPATTVDSLRHIVDRLPDGHPRRGELVDLDKRVRAYSRTPLGGGEAAWRDATAKARSLRPADNLLQVDLRMDAEITLPRQLGAELESAVSAVWRLRNTTLDAAAKLDTYRMDIVERYGTGRLVPLRTLVDSVTGLGFPHHYHQHRHHSKELNARDRALVALAQEAAFAGLREVVLDDPLVERLAQQTGNPGPSENTELSVEVLADTDEAVRTGDYRMVLTNGGFGPGGMFGRFLPTLPELTDPVSRRTHDVLMATPGGERAVPAQVCVPPGNSRSYNVMRGPLLSDAVISIGEGPGPQWTGTRVSVLDDLAVAAYHDRLEVHCTRTGKELIPFAPHALNPDLLPPTARLLLDIGTQQAPPIMPWSWGAAGALPYLPRVRHGRVVFSSARWTPDATLVDSNLSWTRWSERWLEWKDRWKVPDVLYPTFADQRVRVDVRRAADLRLLRAELERKPNTLLYEEPAGGEFGRGWSGGYANEIVFALQAGPQEEQEHVHGHEHEHWHRRRRKTARQVPAVCDVHPPGGEWLYLQVLCPSALQNEILAGHLRQFVSNAREFCDRWFFLRYAEEGRASLRIRFHGDPEDLNGRLLPRAHAWMTELRAARLADELLISTYRPEIGRYGGPEAMAAAEHAFAADSELALDIASLLIHGELDLPRDLLAAANHLDLIRTLAPADWKTWLLGAYPKNNRYHKAFQTYRRRAMTLLDPSDDWKALRAVPGGEQLRDAWRRRAPRVTAYGRLIRRMTAEGLLDSDRTEFSSLLHLSHNRHTGTEADAEHSSYAVLRGFAQAQLDKARNLS